jgi:hypothetical protein
MWQLATSMIGTAMSRGASQIGGRVLDVITDPLKRTALDYANAVWPTAFEEVEVTVYGSPDASKKDLYFLAAAIAFGKCPRRDLFADLPVPGTVIVRDSLTDPIVTFKLQYTYPGVAYAAATIGTMRQLFEGPSNEVIGATWPNSWLWWKSTGQIPNAGPLKYKDRLIVGSVRQEDQRVPFEPELPNDNGTRGTYLEQIMYQALSK